MKRKPNKNLFSFDNVGEWLMRMDDSHTLGGKGGSDRGRNSVHERLTKYQAEICPEQEVNHDEYRYNHGRPTSKDDLLGSGECNDPMNPNLLQEDLNFVSKDVEDRYPDPECKDDDPRQHVDLSDCQFNAKSLDGTAHGNFVSEFVTDAIYQTIANKKPSK